MKTIYLVIGNTGEYADKCDWIVCGYSRKNQAEKHAKRAQERANEIANGRPNRYRVEEGVNQYDPKMQMDYTGTWYGVGKVELRDRLP